VNSFSNLTLWVTGELNYLHAQPDTQITTSKIMYTRCHYSKCIL